MSEAHKERLKVLSTIRYIGSDSATPYYHGSLGNYVRVREPIHAAKVFRFNTSHGTSPIDSTADDTDGSGGDTDIVLYEVDDTDGEDAIVLEKPAESAQAKLSM